MIPYWTTYSYPMIYYPNPYYHSPYTYYNVPMSNNYISPMMQNFNIPEPQSPPNTINCENSEAVNAN